MYAQPTLDNSAEQDAAYELITAWIKNRSAPTFRLAGYAGTGKTTLTARRIIPFCDEQRIHYAVATFTGKAASVLAAKGIGMAQTIHSLMYQRVRDAAGNETWQRRSYLNCKLIIIDEASMVSGSIQDDLESYGVPILYIGDNAQLPPVGKPGEDRNLMRDPDFQLTEIHRQAESSPIIRLARAVRKGMRVLPQGTWGNDEVGRVSIAKGPLQNLLDYDVILCARNVTRHDYNARKRALLGRKLLLEVDDQVICLKNDNKTSLRNGSITRVTEIHYLGSEEICASLIDEVSGDVYRRQMILTSSFGQQPNKDDWFQTSALPMDYAYAITVHKFQGSQAKRVAYIDENLPKTETWRLRYTGITRAEQHVHIAV